MNSRSCISVAVTILIIADYRITRPITSSAPWRNLHLSPGSSPSSNWKSKNVLAMASNKSVCDGDFYFMLDSSTSMGNLVFQKTTKYVKRVISMFAPSQVQHDNLKIGLIRFASRTDLLTRLLSPNDSSLFEMLEQVPFTGGKANIIRAFRLMKSTAIWQHPSGKNRTNVKPRSFKRRKLKQMELNDPPFSVKRRRRLIVVFTNGQFDERNSDLIRATLGVCRKMAASVVFIGISGEYSPINIKKLLMLIDSPQYMYLLGSIARERSPQTDDLSAWNLAAFLCYTLQQHNGALPYQSAI